MELIRIYVFLVLAVLVSVTVADKGQIKYKHLTDKKSWPDADADCRSRDGSLLVLDTHSRVIEFQNKIMLDTEIWTAAYRQHSPWVWVEGCFSASFLTKKDGNRLRLNKASECATLCKDSAYAALKGYMCFCIEDMRDLLPMNARECDTPCPGSPGEMCGGQRGGAVSLYSLGGVNGYKESDKEIAEQLQQTNHEMSRSDWKNCVYILKHDTPIWITADCRKKLPFLCKIYRDNGAIIEYRSPRKKVGSWMEARDMCLEEGGTLADLHANNMEAVSALPDHSEFWVGLYRNTSWAWQTDDIVEKPSWCTSMTEDRTGELHFKTETCSMPKEYICQIPLQVAQAKHSNMVIFLVCGTVAWILAVVTGIVVFYMMRKRGYCKRSSATGSTGELRTSYLDLEEDSSRTRPSRPHSYVNSDVRNQPTCSRPPPADDLRKPNSSKNQDQTARFQASNGNEYASVCMSKFDKRGPLEQYDDLSHGASACGSSNRGSTSTEGDYDIVWDSVKFGKHLNKLTKSARGSTSSENIYTEIEHVTRVEIPPISENCDNLFPPSDAFGLHGNGGKMPLGRTRSKSH
ncbi:uncharacterized protein LOC132743872 isoform X1 [Ruditapes philippinarum]|uniref:uncharacterized protein LOC132743872 isoform X1 n=1 Tax=Ruditapes philippinarum TaxID=129788 RepID=UPI00295C25DB|nr:uncharacterized protein LOC132743872 isoform X1 [Ruditapes philippinarum]